MLVIKIELWPFGQESNKRELGRTYIYNNGEGTSEIGEYEVRVCRNKHKGGEYGPPTKELLYDGKGASRTGEVKNYPRKRLNVWQLVIRSLLSAFPEELNKNGKQ